MTENNNTSNCADCGDIVTSEVACSCAGNWAEWVKKHPSRSFYYPDSAQMFKRKFPCALCGEPVYAYVEFRTDRYWLECGVINQGCGFTSIRENFSKWKVHFVNIEQGDI